MRKWIFALVLGVLSSHAPAPATATAAEHSLCSGFLPKNDLRIPVNKKSRGGIQASQFNAVLDRIQSQYAQEFAARGARLQIIRDWNNAEVNAYATRAGSTWKLYMFGGLARHSTVTSDGFALVACHEVGHHLGGAPKAKDYGLWATNEGGSDYYATLKCLRRYFERDDNEKILAGMRLDRNVVTACEKVHAGRAEQRLCIRATHAGYSAAGLFAALGGSSQISVTTPDRSQVATTYDAHPEAQCRLDTYFQGALCTTPVYQTLSESDYRQGSCYTRRLTQYGLRPRCWFSPNG